MRLAIALPFAMAAQLALAGAALADYSHSQDWFNGLTPEQRSEAQTNLILLGDYYYLVDGQFGTGTYNALVEFQRSQGSVKTGVLGDADMQALHDLAEKVKTDLGIDQVQDQQDEISLPIPAALLTDESKTGQGTKWSTPDGGMTIETIYKPNGDPSFADLFASLSQPGKGRIITSSSFSDTRFVVTGHQDGREFYTMYRNTDGGIVGYQLTWSLPYAQRGNVLSIYIASNFAPLSSLPPAGAVPKTLTAATATQEFGPFSLPARMPDVIKLDGEVSDGFYDDFESALKARPDAKIMLLNSPGGYVDYALAVAHEVHDRGMSTIVQKGSGCYSACAYIFFAGSDREADGELGVHQISADVADLVMAQTTLSDVIDALDTFGVQQTVIVQMLRTPPEDMYVFSATELAKWDVNHGGPVKLAEADVPVNTPPTEETDPSSGDTGVAYVHLAQQSSEAEAERALAYAVDHWASVLGDAKPEIDHDDQPGGTIYRIRVPARSVESANAMCAAIKSAGGGCYVSSASN